MLLGLSSSQQGDTVNFDAMAQGDGEIGVHCENELVAFARAAASWETDPAELAKSRERLVQAIGPKGMLEAAMVVGNFTMMTRIADGTGTPLDEFSAQMSADLRDTLGLNEFASARLSS